MGRGSSPGLPRQQPGLENHQRVPCDLDPGQSARLYLARPGGGGFDVEPLEVGSVVPVSVVLRRPEHLSWQVIDVFLGPWPVDSVVDTCPMASTLPATGSEMLVGVALAGVFAAATGIALLALGVGWPRRRHQLG